MPLNGTDIILERIAQALERIAPPPHAETSLKNADAFIWHEGCLKPAKTINSVELSLLMGIEKHARTLLQNTLRFAEGYPANNALLWGARGMGKSSLIKAVYKEVHKLQKHLALIELHREDIESLPKLLCPLRSSSRRFLVFCDDLSFDKDDTSYKSLKAILEGGIEGRPDNVLFYATSNRRHLMPREMIENERQTGIRPSEAVEEKVSLSDRFGLSLGFYACDQETYLTMVRNYARAHGLTLEQDKSTLEQEALEWASTRGHRSGRVAWQFIQDLAGRQHRRLSASTNNDHPDR